MLDSSANSVSKSVGDVGNNAATNRARRPSIDQPTKASLATTRALPKWRIIRLRMTSEHWVHGARSSPKLRRAVLA
jgi:hypothetical protein